MRDMLNHTLCNKKMQPSPAQAPSLSSQNATAQRIPTKSLVNLVKALRAQYAVQKKSKK